MSEKLIQEQITEINRKLDLLLDEALLQRQNREVVNDLVDDLSIIGKDAVKNIVTDLDKTGIELDSEALRCLILRLIRNIKSLGTLIDTLESVSDLFKDLTPVIKQIGLDATQKFYEFEQKGYFEILNQTGKAVDRIISEYNIEDFKHLSDNLVLVTETLVKIADPRLLTRINATLTALSDIKPEDIEEYSVWRLIRQLNKPEIRKSLGFIMAFLQKMTKTEIDRND